MLPTGELLGFQLTMALVRGQEGATSGTSGPLFSELPANGR
ncbi:hypothetical protein AVDCRST_MAG81-4691 [uncultured Synechococcales cyanobacterium]|uniref:Uncharacterized protein n=1 Tax=uncultured Synechococcales cyanobacterium TaxID=1936017 RepID=A0A6J4VU26_9CYAN|nr:hypothetical protein AVDCRST_MAG81-4691 [uncultured Synechococcales cyanobacterium]